jgi:RES domain-containing protein
MHVRSSSRHRLSRVSFFRSVELAYGHPYDVISGEGTRLYGGRFVEPGTRAVYGSADEETALKEFAARLSRLARRVATLVDLTASRVPRALLTPCLNPHYVAASQEVGEFLRNQGIQAIMFPSAIPGFIGGNVVVFRDATPTPDIVLVNRAQVLRELRRLAKRLER